MRIAPLAAFLFAACVTAGCAVAQQLLNGGGGSGTDTTSAEGGVEAGVDASIVGAGCGVDTNSGAQLCAATSLCPTVVVDTETFPHCGFRIKGSSSELVCGCGESICSMGPFTTCAQAAGLLTSQSEASVCAQVGEDRCTKMPATPSMTSSSSGTSGNSNPTCDHTCLQECGSGAGCATICGCQ